MFIQQALKARPVAEPIDVPAEAAQIEEPVNNNVDTYERPNGLE